MSKESTNNVEAVALSHTYWSQFLNWHRQNPVHQTLQIANGISNVYIPQRILELAENPHKVNALVLENEPSLDIYSSSIRVMIVEKLKKNITNPRVFRKQYPFIQPTMESPYYLPIRTTKGVHYKHGQYKHLVADGVLGFNDMVYLDYMADVLTDYPSVVVTRNLYDRPDLHGQGIGTSFYQRLEKIFSQLGFKFLAGTVFSPHISFFMNTRTNYHSLPNEIKDVLPAWMALQENMYIKCLDLPSTATGTYLT